MREGEMIYILTILFTIVIIVAIVIAAEVDTKRKMRAMQNNNMTRNFFCLECGEKLDGNEQFCHNCGQKLPSLQPLTLQNQYIQPYQQQWGNPTPYIPASYRPLSKWEYFGYNILFGLPVIGIIMLIIFACGGTTNINLKNYAASYFCLDLIILFFLVVFLAIIGTGSFIY